MGKPKQSLRSNRRTPCFMPRPVNIQLQSQEDFKSFRTGIESNPVIKSQQKKARSKPQRRNAKPPNVSRTPLSVQCRSSVTLRSRSKVGAGQTQMSSSSQDPSSLKTFHDSYEQYVNNNTQQTNKQTGLRRSRVDHPSEVAFVSVGKDNVSVSSKANKTDTVAKKMKVPNSRLKSKIRGNSKQKETQRNADYVSSLDKISQAYGEENCDEPLAVEPDVCFDISAREKTRVKHNEGRVSVSHACVQVNMDGPENNQVRTDLNTSEREVSSTSTSVLKTNQFSVSDSLTQLVSPELRSQKTFSISYQTVGALSLLVDADTFETDANADASVSPENTEFCSELQQSSGTGSPSELPLHQSSQSHSENGNAVVTDCVCEKVSTTVRKTYPLRHRKHSLEKGTLPEKRRKRHIEPEKPKKDLQTESHHPTEFHVLSKKPRPARKDVCSSQDDEMCISESMDNNQDTNLTKLCSCDFTSPAEGASLCPVLKTILEENITPIELIEVEKISELDKEARDMLSEEMENRENEMEKSVRREISDIRQQSSEIIQSTVNRRLRSCKTKCTKKPNTTGQTNTDLLSQNVHPDTVSGASEELQALSAETETGPTSLDGVNNKDNIDCKSQKSEDDINPSHDECETDLISSRKNMTSTTRNRRQKSKKQRGTDLNIVKLSEQLDNHLSLCQELPSPYAQKTELTSDPGKELSPPVQNTVSDSLTSVRQIEHQVAELETKIFTESKSPVPDSELETKIFTESKSPAPDSSSKNMRKMESAGTELDLNPTEMMSTLSSVPEVSSESLRKGECAQVCIVTDTESKGNMFDSINHMLKLSPIVPSCHVKTQDTPNTRWFKAQSHLRGKCGWEESLRQHPSKTQLFQAGQTESTASTSQGKVDQQAPAETGGRIEEKDKKNQGRSKAEICRPKTLSRQNSAETEPVRLSPSKKTDPKPSSPTKKRSETSPKNRVPEAVVLEDDEELEQVIEVVSHDKIIPFSENYKTKIGSFKSKLYRKAVLEALVECVQRSGVCVFDTDNDTQLLKWADSGFLSSVPGQQATLDPDPDHPLPDSVMEYLADIGKDIRRKAASLDFRNDNMEEARENAVYAVRKGEKNLKDICIACSDLRQEVKMEHPLFEGGLCADCQNELTETMYAIGDDGLHSFCAVCGAGGDLFVCDSPECKRVYCRPCVEELGGEVVLSQVIAAKKWQCFLCMVYDDQSECLLHPRSDWQERVIMFFDTGYRVQVPSLDYFKTKRPLRVLSLFDGIGSGKLTLDQLGFKVDVYYACEIDQDAIVVTRCNHGSSVIQVGNVNKLLYKELTEMSPIDLLIGGSPCNDLSLANPVRRGFQTDSTALLFFEFVRVRDSLQKLNRDRHLFWLYENVASMKTDFKNTMSRFLNCEPALWDSRYMSAQRRGRYFWGNIPGMYSTPAISTHMHENVDLNSVLVQNCNRRATINKMGCVTTRTNSLKHGKNDELFPVEMEGEATGIWIPEVERLFGYPPHYTDVGNLPVTRRHKLLGKSWSIPIIKQLLAPLRRYFATDDSQ